MLICLSPLAILLKITFIIHKEKKPTTLPLVRAGAWEGRRSWADPARRTEPVPGYCRHSSAERRPGSAKPPRSVLGTGSWLLCTALPEPGTAGGSELGPADVINTYACHEQKGQEKSWRGSDLFSLSGVGRWGWGEGSRTAPLRIAAHSKLSLSACHCLTIIATKRENKIRIIIKATQPFQINTLLQ